MTRKIPRQPVRDKCQLCHGARGGVPGNENIVRFVVCDYCHAEFGASAAEPDPAAIITALNNLASASAELLRDDIDMLDYPMKDVYGRTAKQEIRDGYDLSSFWSEVGLYGRVGKEAARTLLCRSREVKEAITAARKALLGHGKPVGLQAWITNRYHEYASDPARTPIDSHLKECTPLRLSAECPCRIFWAQM